MTEVEEFISTKEVPSWRARVYKRAARKVDNGVRAKNIAGPSEEINLLDDRTLTWRTSVVAENHVAVEISGPKSQHQKFSRTDSDLLRRINYQKLTFNPLLIPFIWGTRNRRRQEEKAVRRHAG